MHVQSTAELVYLRVPQVAARLNVHRTTVYRAIESGDLAAVRLGGRKGMRVSEDALADYVAASAVRPTLVTAEVAA